MKKEINILSHTNELEIKFSLMGNLKVLTLKHIKQYPC